jgi:hypothetical protein
MDAIASEENRFLAMIFSLLPTCAIEAEASQSVKIVANAKGSLKPELEVY